MYRISTTSCVRCNNICLRGLVQHSGVYVDWMRAHARDRAWRFGLQWIKKRSSSICRTWIRFRWRIDLLVVVCAGNSELTVWLSVRVIARAWVIFHRHRTWWEYVARETILENSGRVRGLILSFQFSGLAVDRNWFVIFWILNPILCVCNEENAYLSSTCSTLHACTAACRQQFSHV